MPRNLHLAPFPCEPPLLVEQEGGPLDAKLLPGGLVDLEFTVHVKQLLERRGFDPNLSRAIDVLDLPAELARAHDLLTRLIVTLRLVAPDAAEPESPATRALIARALQVVDWPAVLVALDCARQAVTAAWKGVTHGQAAARDGYGT